MDEDNNKQKGQTFGDYAAGVDNPDAVLDLFESRTKDEGTVNTEDLSEEELAAIQELIGETTSRRPIDPNGSVGANKPKVSTSKTQVPSKPVTHASLRQRFSKFLAAGAITLSLLVGALAVHGGIDVYHKLDDMATRNEIRENAISTQVENLEKEMIDVEFLTNVIGRDGTPTTAMLADLTTADFRKLDFSSSKEGQQRIFAAYTLFGESPEFYKILNAASEIDGIQYSDIKAYAASHCNENIDATTAYVNWSKNIISDWTDTYLEEHPEYVATTTTTYSKKGGNAR